MKNLERVYCGKKERKWVTNFARQNNLKASFVVSAAIKHFIDSNEYKRFVK